MWSLGQGTKLQNANEPYEEVVDVMVLSRAEELLTKKSGALRIM